MRGEGSYLNTLASCQRESLGALQIMTGSQNNFSLPLKHKDDFSCFTMVVTPARGGCLAVHDVDFLPASIIDDAQKLSPDIGELAVASDSAAGMQGVGRNGPVKGLGARGYQEVCSTELSITLAERVCLPSFVHVGR